MLLRLSRFSFWLAALVAAAALFAPRGHETTLTLLAMAASAMAFLLWRSGIASHRAAGRAALVDAPSMPALDEPTLLEATALLVREIESAPSFEAALHAAARVLRAELGARETSVVEVRDADATHAQVTDLIEAQPGFHPLSRRVRLDGTPLGRAIDAAVPVIEPPVAIALPVTHAHAAASGTVIAVIELRGLALRIDP